VQVTTIRLLPFPGLPRPAHEVHVEIARQPGVLLLWYVIKGDLTELQIPPIGKPARVNGLWEHTCFEAFFRNRDGEPYCEFNMAPSYQWNGYHFDSYRTGIAYLREPEPVVAITDKPGLLSVGVEFDLDALPMPAPWKLGLCAVLEDKKGGKSYWALRHAPGKPDFHHPDCFALELPASKRA